MAATIARSRRIGLSPQEVSQVVPEAVSADVDGSLSITYRDLFVLGLRATQHLTQQQRKLEAQVGELERRLILLGDVLDRQQQTRQTT